MAQAASSIENWDAERTLREVSSLEAKLSRGFLRCRPEGWFPGFAAQWLPLAHSLGGELRIIECKPLISLPTTDVSGFTGRIDGEEIAMLVDNEAANVILDVAVPDAGAKARKIVLEYLARRLLSTLASAWSGPESSTIQFEGEAKVGQFAKSPTIKMVCSVNGRLCTMYVALGIRTVERLDGLWRRQIFSTLKTPVGQNQLRVEVAQLAVPPSMLGDYTRPGTIIDLEIPVSDQVTLRLGNKPWLGARLCNVEGSFGLEMLAGPASVPGLPDGTTRLAIEVGVLDCDASQIAEMSQPNAIMGTPWALTDSVSMSINGEVVGTGLLRVYEGRFAINVS